MWDAIHRAAATVDGWDFGSIVARGAHVVVERQFGADCDFAKRHEADSRVARYEPLLRHQVRSARVVEKARNVATQSFG